MNLQERKKQMLRLRRGGASLSEIGDKYGLTRERVRQILKYTDTDGLYCRSLAFKMSKLKIPAGKTRIELARFLGVNRNTVAIHLKSYKFAPDWNKPNVKRHETYARMRRKGMLLREIAARFNTVQETISASLKKYHPELVRPNRRTSNAPATKEQRQ